MVQVRRIEIEIDTSRFQLIKMRFKLFIAALFLQSCTQQSVRQENEAKLAPYSGAMRVSDLRTPQDVRRYLVNHVGKKKLKEWDKHVSDDTTVISIYDENGIQTGTAVGK